MRSCSASSETFFCCYCFFLYFMCVCDVIHLLFIVVLLGGFIFVFLGLRAWTTIAWVWFFFKTRSHPLDWPWTCSVEQTGLELLALLWLLSPLPSECAQISTEWSTTSQCFSFLSRVQGQPEQLSAALSQKRTWGCGTVGARLPSLYDIIGPLRGR